MAEEESHTRSRSMETSLRMRLDNGIPLTPKLLGYSHDEDGQLIINPTEAPTVKLCFYMYLYGYSTQQIADTLIALGRKSYLGNICWTANSIVQILRNERHCGDVLTRKTYTPDFHTHKAKKNYGKNRKVYIKTITKQSSPAMILLPFNICLTMQNTATNLFTRTESNFIRHTKRFCHNKSALGGIQRNRLSSSRSKHLRTTCGNRYRTTDSC